MRRTWMLLLVTVLLAVFLAVPAMAADDCCDGGHCATCAGDAPHGGWTALATDTVFENNAKYYVPAEGLTADLTVTGDITVTICLNNATLKGRMTVSSGATVNIVDCSAVTDGVTGGKMQGIDVTAASVTNGGTLYVDGGVVNIYNGTITGGTAADGGNIYIVNSGVVTLFRGVISDGQSTGQGGNVYIAAGTLNMGKADEVETSELNESAVITNGTTTGTNKHGGNIRSGGSGKLNMYYGTISDGKATGQGGNMCLNGPLTMHGGVIRDGKTAWKTSTSTGTSTSGNANIWFQNGSAKLIMDGGHIYGYVSFYNTGAEALQLSGKAKIYAPDTDGDGLSDGGVSALVNPIFLDKKLDNEAKIAISVSADTTTITYNEEKSYEGIEDDWTGYINHQIVGYKDFWWTWQDKDEEGVEDGVGEIVRQAEASNTIWHCLCGANAGEDHIGDCNEFDVSWTKITSNSKLNTSGYYYLDLSAATAAGTDSAGTPVYDFGWSGSLASTTTSQDVYLDLNGYSLEAAEGSRFLQFYNGSRTAAHTVTITDASWGHTGRIGTYGAFIEEREFTSTGNPQGRLFWLSMGITKTDSSYGDTLNVYRTTLDASSLPLGNAYWVGSIACVVGKSNANFYECDMTGGNVAKPASGAQIGAGIQAGGTALVTITGGTLVAGQGHQGAGIGTNGGGTVVIDDVDITGGTATAGGAIHNYKGDITVKNSTITGGTGGAVNNYSGSLTLINTTVTGATGGGVLVGANSGTVTLGGSTNITDNTGGNLYLASGKVITLSSTDPLTAKAKVGITCADAAADRALSGDVPDDSVLTGLFSDDATYKLALKDDNILYRVSADTVMGATVNDGGIMLPLPKAVAMASGNDFVRLLSDYTGTITVDHSLNLDLNGKKITPDEGKSAIVLTAGDLKLADSANASYNDAQGRVTIDNHSGTIVRAFITGTFTNYGYNHRYLVLKHADNTYSSHRIYLAVQNPVLFPATASVSFRTMLVCDETVAGYIDDYGIAAAGTGEEFRVSYGSKVLPFGTEQNQNSKVAGIVNILDGENDQTRATTQLSAYAYMNLNDYFEGDKEITSSTKSANLKQVVQNADEATLTNPQKIAMARMYNRYIDLMKDWGLTQISNLNVDTSTIKSHCLCGDPDSTNNPCAVKGHIQLDWEPLPEDFKGGALYEGNYYLTGDLELTEQMNIPAGNMVCIDTQGNNITVTDGTMDRGALVYGVLNLTNSTYHEDSTKMSTFTGRGRADTNGGTVLITGASGNMSLYTGVTLACTPHAESKLTQGTVTVYLGSMNIYGGVVQGVSGGQNGGAIRTNGYVFINSGSIIGGTGNANGGAISTYGDAEVMIRESAEITGGEAENGGLIYMVNGVVTLYNKTLTGTTATNGGAVYVENGTLNLNGTVTGDSYNTVLSGGTADKGGVVYVKSGTLNVNGAKIVGGQANEYETTETVDEVETTVNNPGMGGAIYVEAGNVNLTSSACVDGGTASLGGAVYLEDGSFTMDSSTVQNGHATRTSKTSADGCGSNFYVLAGTLKITNNSVVQGGTSNYYDADGYGGSVLYAKGGDITVEDSKLYGVLSQNWKRGGTIFNNGGTITIENTEVTASKVGNNGSVLLNAAGSFTMKGSSKLDASEHSKVAYGGAVVNGGTFKLEGGEIIGCASGYSSGTTYHGGGAVHTSGDFEMSGGTIRGGSTADTATSNYQNLGGNVRVSGGTFTMTGGSIEGGAATGTKSLGGGNVAISGGTFEMTGGTISGGTSSTNGGNVYLATGTFNLNGGTIGSESALTATQAALGGNVYMASGNFTMSAGTIQNGYATTHAGNVYMADGTFTLGKEGVENPDTLNESAKITGGYSEGNSGSIYLGTAATLNIHYGTISGGHAANQAGNLHTYGTVNMYGGVIKDGISVKATNNKNIWVRNGLLNVSGGHIHGYIFTYQHEKLIKVSGDAKIYAEDASGNIIHGIVLNAGSGDAKLMVGELTENAKVAVARNAVGLAIAATDTEGNVTDLEACDRYIRDGKLVAFGANQLTWEAADAEAGTVEGIYYQRPTDEVWHCICGAAAGDDHIGECTGHEVQWTKWSLDSNTHLPLTPGYYYLTGTENSGNEPYLQLGIGTTYCYDYYYDSTNNSYKRLYRVSLDADGNALDTPIYWDPVNEVEVAEVTSDADLVENIGIYIDLNGHKVQGTDATRVINGLNSNNITIDENGEKKTYKYQRHGKLNLHLCDGTNGHEGALAAYGTYSGQAYNNGGSAQGAVVWMPGAGDQLNGYRVELNASNVKMGWGNALTTNANADLYQCELVGGVSQGYLQLGETASLLEDGNVNSKSIKGSANGGGTLLVDVDATVTMHGGTIRDGVSVYRYMAGSNGVGYDRSSGGGNVFINGGTFIVDGTESTATISGGKALLYDAAGTNPTGGAYKYGAGGAVYLGSGQFIVKGDVNISDNVSGSVTGTLVADPTVVGSLGGYLDMSAAVISETGNDNVYLNGYVMQVENVTGKLGFNMVSYEGTFAKLLNNTTTADAYASILVRDDGETNEYVIDGDQLLIAATDYTVGYGSYSINPTAEDIANGLALSGYGNTNYNSSGESTRFTRTGWGDTETMIRYGLLATAMAFTDTQGDTVIVINVDATSFSKDVADGVKNRVSVATGVPRENITVSAAHQHSTPAIVTTYWTNTAGKYTAKPTVTIDSYADLYSGTQLEANEPRVLRTNYAATFYSGIVNAAVAAMEDRETVTVTAGVLDTASDTQQFNFVRNIKLMKDDEHVGMYTDNHRDLNPSEYDSMEYESDVDTTMQLVKFTRSDGTAIVLANFQTHPHLGAGTYNLDITSDVVGAFRTQLSSLYGGDVQVMYLSGAGGDVNTTSKISEDVTNLQGYLTTTSSSTPEQKAERVTQYGTALAGVAKTFLDANMTSVDVTNADVEAMAQTYTFHVWDQKAEYEAAGKADLYASLVERSKLLVNWSTNSYRNNPYSYWEDGTYKVINGDWTASTDSDATTHWDYFVNNLTAGLTEKGDEIHSYQHANGVRNRYERIYEDNNPTGEFEITAYNLGGIGFVAAPYEMFQMNGQQIRNQDSFGVTVIATQANGANGYIPTADAYVNGGYSTDTTIYAPGTGEALVTTYVEMLGTVAGN